MNADYFTVGYLSFFNVRSDSAAVYERHISSEERTVSVSAEVTEVCLACANDSLSGFGVVYRKSDLGFGDNRLNKLIELRGDSVDELKCFCIVFGNFSDERK